MQFEFATASRIIFGPGKLSIINDLTEQFGKRILVVSGAPWDATDRLLSLVQLDSSDQGFITVDHEPTVDSIRKLLEIARGTEPEVIIGMGGGSAIDTAKTISALLTNLGDVTEYLEVIGKNQPLTSTSIPLIAIPTTAGTGSEVTRNAVIGAPEQKVKVSLRGKQLLPRIALVDPQLTLSLPPDITAFTGLDALTQLIEPLTSDLSNPFTDALCIEGIQKIGRSFYQAFDHGNDLATREDMSIAALFSGIALANSKLGAVHGFAGPIGGEIHAHHGAICASLLANVMETNISALTDRSPNHPALQRYNLIGRLLCGSPTASASDAINWIRSFCSHAHIPTLSSLGMTQDQFPNIIDKAQKASSMKGNPIILSEAELRNILEISF